MTVSPANLGRGDSRPVEVSVIIVNWNSAHYVQLCLASIARNPPPIPYEMVVVDSGSFDSCGEMLRKDFPDAIFVQSEKNVGFARANNLGVRHAAGSILMFLNPDTEILGDAIQTLCNVLEVESDAGVVGARLRNTDGSLQTTCIQAFPTILNQILDSDWLQKRFPRSPLWGMAALFETASTPSAVEVISGACMMMKRTVFESLSGFDGRFFMYSEDLDLCYRIRNAGLRCLYVPSAEVVHHGGGSSSSARSMFSVVMMRESVSRLLTLHRGVWVATIYRMASGLCALLRLSVILILTAIAKLTGASSREGARRKWVAVLRWSLGLETWTRSKSTESGVGMESHVSRPTREEASKRSCVV